MIDSRIQNGKVYRLFEGITKRWFFQKTQPNTLTLFAFVSGVLSAICLFLLGGFSDSFSDPFKITLRILSAICLAISFFFDICDGILARMTHTTIFGGMIDIFSDRFIEVMILIGIVATNPPLLLWPGISCLGAIILCITIFLLVGSATNRLQKGQLSSKEKIIIYTGGLMERTETILFLEVMILIPPIQVIVMWIFAGLVFFTAIQRVLLAYRVFYSKSQE